MAARPARKREWQYVGLDEAKSLGNVVRSSGDVVVGGRENSCGHRVSRISKCCCGVGTTCSKYLLIGEGSQQAVGS